MFDSAGRFAGIGHDARVVRRGINANTVEVDVSFNGPFNLSGSYRISDFGGHRIYGGPLNYGCADAVSDKLVDANNYWPSLGWSQRLFLMVLPSGKSQLSLALLSRGERLEYAVVGEYSRGTTPPPSVVAGFPDELCDDPLAGREVNLVSRPGTWSGELTVLNDTDDKPTATHYREHTTTAACDNSSAVVSTLEGTGFTEAVQMHFASDGWSRWTTHRSSSSSTSTTSAVSAKSPEAAGGWSTNEVVGSESLWGARAVSGNLLFASGLRLWRREVIRSDGHSKAVLHTWFRGTSRCGTVHGVLDFIPQQGG